MNKKLIKLYQKKSKSVEYTKYLDSLTNEDKFILPPPNDGEKVLKGG